MHEGNTSSKIMFGRGAPWIGIRRSHGMTSSSVLCRTGILGHYCPMAWRGHVKAFPGRRWASSSSGVVELAYEKAEPPSLPKEDAKPIVILHGLLYASGPCTRGDSIVTYMQRAETELAFLG